MERSPGRRRFLKSVTALTAASLPPAGVAADAHSQHPAHVAQAKPPGALATQMQAYVYLTPPEAEFVEAAVARLIPADELGPGAKEAGVALFIDHQLAGAWGTMARNYRQGPWPEGTPQQGYQSPLTPQEVYRAAIREVNQQCTKQYGKAFAELTATQKDDVLRALDEGKLALESVSARLFFDMLWDNTQEGFFADPVYGGNRDKVGWRLVGFPGVAAVYIQHIDKYNVAYRARPVSIADLQQKIAKVDEHGHPVHVMLTANARE